MDRKLVNNIKRLFPDFSDELKEELALANNCQSIAYKKALETFNLSFKVSSISLTAASSDSKIKREFCEREVELMSEDLEPAKNRITYEKSVSDPPIKFERFTLVKRVWRSRIARPIFLIILNYIAIKFMTISLLRYRLESDLSVWQPVFSANATKTRECALKDDIPEVPPRIRKYNQWLESIGDPTISITSSPVVLYQVMSIFPMILYELSLILIQSNDVRADYMRFMWNPSAERRRLQVEVYKVAQSVVNNEIRGNKLSRENYSRNMKLTDNLIRNGLIRNDNNLFQEELNSLHVLNLIRQVKPSNLTPTWHEFLINFYNTLQYIMSSLTFCTSLLITIVLVLADLIFRASRRVDQLECQKWMPNGTLYRNILQLDEQSSPEDTQAFEKFDNSLKGLIYLALFVESKLYFRWNRILTLIEMLFIYILTCWWIGFFELVYLLFIMDKLKWQKQIEEQLECCANLCSRLELLDSKEEKLHIINIIIVTYCNYIVFKEQYNHFLKTLRILIVPMLLPPCHVLLVSYLTAKNTNSMLMIPVLIGTAYFIIHINTYLVTSSMLFIRSCRIIKNISRMLSYIAYQPEDQSHIFDLWRKQLLEEEQLKKLFAVRFLGQYISLSLTASANVYFLLLLILLFRITSGNSMMSESTIYKLLR